MTDLEALADELRASIDELVAVAGESRRRPARRPTRRFTPRAERARGVCPHRRPAMRLLERLVIVVVSFAIAVGVIVVLSGGPLAGRDNPGLTGPGGQLGTPVPRPRRRPPGSRGAPAARTTRSRRPAAPHVPAAVRHDETQLSDDQLLQALSLGDVVVMYGTQPAPAGSARRWPPPTRGPFSRALAAAGQAVILARRPGTHGTAGPGLDAHVARSRRLRPAVARLHRALPRTRCAAVP